MEVELFIELGVLAFPVDETGSEATHASRREEPAFERHAVASLAGVSRAPCA
jgi:hypothetical protein